METKLNSTQKAQLRIENDIATFLANGGVIQHPTFEDSAFYNKRKFNRQTNGHAKLTSAEVIDIRNQVQPETPAHKRMNLMMKLSKKYDVSYYTIRSVVLKETYKDVT